MQPLSDLLPSWIDPSILPSVLFANDMGGAPLAVEAARDRALGAFNAMVVSSMMGCTVSFTIPFALGGVPKELHRDMLLGLLCGCNNENTNGTKGDEVYSLVSDTATCTSAGTATYKCNSCSASYTESSPKKAHNHVENSYKAPTSEAEGEITYKCTDCGDIKTERLEKLSAIIEPKTKTINCKDGVLIRPNFAFIPEGATVEWTASNGCFNVDVDAEGNLKAISNSSGDTTFTAKVKLEDGTYMTDMYGNEVVSTTTVKSNAGFFQKIIGFFKSLFGKTKIHE
jgi:DNA-directed RNA polymerase subunit RPC12/RpoP